MAKDPAFLFYYQDFLVGTSFMSNEEVGAYIRILCHLADKGELSEEHMKNICQTYEVYNFIKSKFNKNGNGTYYNKRLKEEIEKRRKYAESRRKNRLGKNICKSYDKHMENENGDENINNNNNNNREEKLEKLSQLISYWNATLTIPKNLEKEFIEELYDKFGYDKTKLIIRQFAEDGFRKVKTMREALNPDGTIKPRNKKEEGIVIEYRPA